MGYRYLVQFFVNPLRGNNIIIKQHQVCIEQKIRQKCLVLYLNFGDIIIVSVYNVIDLNFTLRNFHGRRLPGKGAFCRNPNDSSSTAAQ